jgi:hypothetical protein
VSLDDVPRWIEPETIEHAEVALDVDDSEYDWEPSRVEAAVKCLRHPELSAVWERAKSYFAGLPCRGQIQLFDVINGSLPCDYAHYCTLGEAEEWKSKFLTKISEVNALWKGRPVNFSSEMIVSELQKTLTIPDGTELIGPSSPGQHWVNFLLKTESGAKLFEYSSKGFGKHVKGSNARRTYFVRELSAAIMKMTGQWKRVTVAEITSALFDCNFTAK